MILNDKKEKVKFVIYGLVPVLRVDGVRSRHTTHTLASVESVVINVQPVGLFIRGMSA